MLLKLLKLIKRISLNILGDIKVFRFPFFLIYDPGSYEVKGYHTRQAMEVLEPGDIVLRKFINYLDGYFIPGEYSHTGLYVGNNIVIHAIAEGVSSIDIIDFLRCDKFIILRAKDEEARKRAVERAKRWWIKNREYDFDFKSNNGKLYCHELGVEAYKELKLEKKTTKILGITLSPRYLAESFTTSDKFETVLKIN